MDQTSAAKARADAKRPPTAARTSQAAIDCREGVTDPALLTGTNDLVRVAQDHTPAFAFNAKQIFVARVISHGLEALGTHSAIERIKNIGASPARLKVTAD